MSDQLHLTPIDHDNLKLRLACEKFQGFIHDLDDLHLYDKATLLELDQKFLEFLRETFTQNSAFLNQQPILTSGLVGVITEFLIFSTDNIFTKDSKNQLEIIEYIINLVQPLQNLNIGSYVYTSNFEEFNFTFQRLENSQEFTHELLRMSEHYKYGVPSTLVEQFDSFIFEIINEINTKGSKIPEALYINILNDNIHKLNSFFAKFMKFIRFLSTMNNGHEIGVQLFSKININVLLGDTKEA